MRLVKRDIRGIACVLGCVASLAVTPSFASASSINSPDNGTTLIPGGTTTFSGQTFTVPSSPATDNFLHTLTITRFERTDSGSFKIYITGTSGGEPNVPPTGPFLFESNTFTGPIGTGPFTVHPNLNVTPGSSYAWFTEAIPGSEPAVGGSLNSYPDGTNIAWLSGSSWGIFSGSDRAFTADFSAGKAATSTGLSCPTMTVGIQSTCTVTVTRLGGGGTPSGAVSLGAAGGSFASGTCTLNASGQCSPQFTPSSPVVNATAAYQGDSTNLTSSGSFPLTVNRRTTNLTNPACSSSSPKVGQEISCNLRVQDGSGGTASQPGGTTDWTTSGSGTFNPSASCPLTGLGPSSSHCALGFTPTSAGPHTISASYSGGSIHDPNGPVVVHSLTAVKRDSTIDAFACTPASLTAGQVSTCTVEVGDHDVGTQTTPTGDVTFVKTGAGNLTAPNCTLDAGGECSVSYVPSAAGASSITASYGGDSIHNAAVDDDAAVNAADPPRAALDCSKLQRKLRRQRRNLKKADSDDKKAQLQANIEKTLDRIALRGCP